MISRDLLEKLAKGIIPLEHYDLFALLDELSNELLEWRRLAEVMNMIQEEVPVNWEGLMSREEKSEPVR